MRSSNESDFIVVRDAAAERRNTGLNFGRASFGPMVGTTGPSAMGLPPKPVIEIQSLTPEGIRDAAADASVLHVMRPLPIRLIHPVDTHDVPASASAAAGPTWGVSAVGADLSPFNGAGVTVAVLDTGVDESHPAFTGVHITAKDFTGSATGANDLNGHGTHCLGTILGRDVDGMRIGVAPGITKALIGKVLNDNGGGTSDAIFDAMLWANSNGAQVISMSLGFDFPGAVQQLVDSGMPPNLATSQILESFRTHLDVFNSIVDVMEAKSPFNGGTVICAAAGNESDRKKRPDFEVGVAIPAVAEGIISVGALGRNMGQNGMLEIAFFSNTGPTLSAPGVDIYSAKAGTKKLVSLNGTSMATPHVAGVAALWWQALHDRGQVIPTAAAVSAALRANCSVANLTPVAAQDILDRGDGLVQAPKR